MNDTPENVSSDHAADASDSLDRILASDDAHAEVRVFGGRATALQDSATTGAGDDRDGEQFDREERAALRRVGGLSTELEDVTEVEYRKVRLENVVLIGVYSRSDSTRSYSRM